MQAHRNEIRFSLGSEVRKKAGHAVRGVISESKCMHARKKDD